MQREKFSDITVNIDVEKVIKSASFGCPLIAGNFDGVDGYFECNGYDEVIHTLINNSTLKTVPLTTPTEATVWETEKGGITTFTKNKGAITTNGYDEATDDTGMIDYDGKTFNYLDCREDSIITFDSTGFNRPILNFGVALTNNKGKQSTENHSNSMITIRKNDKVYKTYVVTKDSPIMITERLDKPKTGTTDTYSIECSYGIYLFGLGVCDFGVRLTDAIETFYMQDNAPEKVAIYSYNTSEDVDYNALMNLFSKDWRSMIFVGSQVDRFIQEVSKYAEIKRDKLIFVLDSTATTDSGISQFSSYFSGCERTICFLNNEDDLGKGAKTITGLVAETATKPIGSFTYKNIPLKNVPTADVTASELKAIHEANINSYVTKCGQGVTSEGKTMSGEYIDIVDAKDWLILQIEYKVQQALINNDKIPYTDTGINYLASIVVDVLNNAWRNGMINTTDEGQGDYTVNFAPRAETKKEDRAARRYLEGKFNFNLAGAIHEATVNGTILI